MRCGGGRRTNSTGTIWRRKSGLWEQATSTRSTGKRWASFAQYIQWVAGRRPSSTPAAASRNAPVQTEATRRAWVARSRTQSTQRRIRGGGLGALATGDQKGIQ